MGHLLLSQENGTSINFAYLAGIQATSFIDCAVAKIACESDSLLSQSSPVSGFNARNAWDIVLDLGAKIRLPLLTKQSLPVTISV